MDFYFILEVISKDDHLDKIILDHDKGLVFMANLQDRLILGCETLNKENPGMFK